MSKPAEDEAADASKTSSRTTSASPLAYIEITPLDPSDFVLCGEDPAIHSKLDAEIPSFTAASLKLQLIQTTTRAELGGEAPLQIEWCDFSEQPLSISESSSALVRSGLLFSGARDCKKPVVFFRQSNPSALRTLWPCQCRAFTVLSPRRPIIQSATFSPIRVTESTLVRVCPLKSQIWKERLTGEYPEGASSPKEWQEIEHNHNPETVCELRLHLKNLLSRDTWIGTTSDAFLIRRQQIERKAAIQVALHSYIHASSSLTSATQRQERKSPNNLFQKGALLVHSPHHGAGKSCLVEMLLRRDLHCHTIHVIRPGPLLARYGVYADAALSAIVHQVVLSAAFRREQVAVILDGLDAFLPLSSTYDAALPVLNGVTSYLKQLTRSLERRNEIPFPSAQAALYNWNGKRGYVLPVKFCLIGVVTCPDDGYRSSSGLSVFDSLAATRYRLPTLSAATRLAAFQWSCQETGVVLSESLEKKLPLLAASAVWARGSDFCRVAQRLLESTTGQGRNVVSVELFQNVLASVAGPVSSGSDVSFIAETDDEHDLFATVGGNQEAKTALEDALAMDSKRRSMLSSLGLAPPACILLYGPPGTGKTLLARAVSKLLRSNSTGSSSSIGGAFISLSATDIVRAEVGSGEKMVAQAFETARMNAPSVVFIDEFQALFVERSSSGGSTRLSSTLLTCMDDLKRWRDINQSEHESTGSASKEGHIVVLAATNMPWMIDKSFLRPGRFDRAVHVGLPTLEERVAILKLHLGRMRIRTDDMDAMCLRLAALTDGFSGADIAALARAAAVHCLMSQAESIEEDHLLAVLDEGFLPSSDAKLVERISKWRLQ